MASHDVRKAVESFFSAHAPGGRSSADAFPAWWLHREFELSPADAIVCASTGSHDHGLDGFHLQLKEGQDPTLHLIQAKYSAAHKPIRDGVAEFRRTLDRLSQLMHGQVANDTENNVWVRLRARLDGVDTQALRLHCRVIHLAEADEDTLLAAARAERTAFEEAAETIFPDHKVVLSLSSAKAATASHVVVAPSEKKTLVFEGIDISSDGNSLFIGLGKLADLVRLYEEMGDIIFAKNVRAFNVRAKENGPGRHLRETLRRTCTTQDERGLDPLHFTLFHNGVTVHVRSAERHEQGLIVRSPSILNGCQTVKNAWLFKTDKLLRTRISESAWETIRVPIRIVRTTDDSLVQRITVSNNRQTAVRPSGFRANDPVQIALGDRFHAAGIFYERQQDSFLNLRKSSPRVLEEEYRHSFDAPLGMEELAQALATVSTSRELSAAAKIADLFEGASYEKLFSKHNTAHIPLLVFITNVFRNAHLALKDTKAKSSKLDPLVPSRFRYLATRVIVRWTVVHQPESVATWGSEVIVRPGQRHPFREWMRKVMSPQQARLQMLIPEYWDQADGWPPATDKTTSDKLLKKLSLNDVDVFSEYNP